MTSNSITHNSRTASGVHSRTAAGFTLIELMVVITIIGLLASSVLVALGNARARARDARRTADIRALMTALELYNNDNTSYILSTTKANVSTALTSLVPTYLDKLPVDPRGDGAGTNTGDGAGLTDGFEYVYESDSNTDGYAVRMYYERSATVAGANDQECIRGVNMANAANTIGTIRTCK